MIQGTHDFSFFQGAARGMTDKEKRLNASPGDNVCTMESVSIHETPITDSNVQLPNCFAKQYTMTITGDRFLYKMVRLLVGAVVDTGTGKLELDVLQAALDGNNAPRRKTCAPAYGLLLQDVDYKTAVAWQPLHN
jgi:tRNA pseudouridine38-40 synthase